MLRASSSGDPVVRLRATDDKAYVQNTPDRCGKGGIDLRHSPRSGRGRVHDCARASRKRWARIAWWQTNGRDSGLCLKPGCSTFDVSLLQLLREWFGTRRSLSVWREKRPSPERIPHNRNYRVSMPEDRDGEPKKELTVDRLGTEPPAVIRKENSARLRQGDAVRRGGCGWGLYQTAIPPDPSGWQMTRKMVPEIREFEQRWKPLGLFLRRLHKYRVQFVGLLAVSTTLQNEN